MNKQRKVLITTTYNEMGIIIDTKAEEVAQPEHLVKEFGDLVKDLAKDCISRQWLMECVDEGWIKFDTQEDENRFVHLIRDIAPSAQSTMGQVNQGDTVNERAVKAEALSEGMQPHWIPCSERLPEANGRYLVTRGLNACGALWNRVYIINYSDLMGLKSERIWWGGNVGKSDFERYDDVIAWMPLPKPYGGESE